MPLTLPDGTILQEDNILQNIFAGDRRYPHSTIALYDHTICSPHNEVREIDILSLNALNAFNNDAARTMENIWNNRLFIADQIATITTESFETYWAQMQAVQIPEQIDAISQALNMIIDRVDRLSHTRTSKLAHRLRPNIIPVWDNQIEVWYQGLPDDTWPTYLNGVFFGHQLDNGFGGILEQDNLNCLRGIRGQIGPNLSLLRIWDIILWWVAQNGLPGPLQ